MSVNAHASDISVERFRVRFLHKLATRRRILSENIQKWPVTLTISLIGGIQFALYLLFAVALASLPLAIVALLTTIFSVVVKLLGQPAQIVKLWNARSSKGVSLLNAFCNTASYFCWVGYGYRTHSWVIFLAQGLGIIGTVIIQNLVLGFLVFQPQTSFGHPDTSPCKECERILVGTPALSKWSAPCLCGRGYWHVIRILDTENRNMPGCVLVETRCSSCDRCAKFELGRIEDPKLWEPYTYQLQGNLPRQLQGNLPENTWVSVGLEVYLLTQRHFLATASLHGSSLPYFRQYVPTVSEFWDPVLEISGRILMPDCMTPLVSGSTLLV